MALAAAIAVAALQTCAAAVAQNLPGGTTQSIPVGDAPVVRVDLRSATRLIIKTAERRSVEIESTGPVVAQHFDAQQVGAALRPQIDIFAATVQGPMGQITLLPENFVLPPLRGGQHDGVEIRGIDVGEVTITIPESTALVIAHLERGRMVLRDYREGIFISRVHNGSLMLNGDSGAGFAEVARGPLVVQQSSFGRLRARTAMGNVLFEHCSARQIEVTSILGNIVYDNGSFGSGLARFESLYGNVALGIGTGGVRIGAHSAAGRIYTSLDGSARVSGSGSDLQAQVNGGGPVVTASSGSGAVYVYGGSLRRDRTMGNGWGMMRSIMPRRHPAPVKARTFGAPRHRV
ncbi:MAG: hypothetical protein M3M96_07085 [Candidatus Eremiobacteraeota bacterium]|nr:hypothetical protein [Candidatus Eremiobacteraeota bacterium]